jgi:5-methylcytosine-specific restriction endonuclease McrA
MTTKLRGQIKERDNYACLICVVSLSVEPHLLLEVDHILPVSRGGLSVPENLQTLCWKCNRSKGAKVMRELNIPSSGIRGHYEIANV